MLFVRKVDTSKGFAPKCHVDDSMRSPARHAFRLDGQLDKGVLSPNLHQLILTMARVRNVVSSMLMEGVRVNLAAARAVVESGKSTTDNEEQVLRFAERYRWIHETPADKLPEPDLKLAKTLHKELFAGHDDYGPGKVKDGPNAIVDPITGRILFECTPPERVEAEMAALQAWLKAKSEAELEPVVAAIWFAEFEAIHPFRDGNGRLGRLLNLLVLKKLGLQNIVLVPLDARFYHNRDRYYDRLSATNDGVMWHVWARHYCKELETAYRQAVSMGDLQAVLDQQTSKPTRAMLEWILLGGNAWFARGDYPNPKKFSDVALTKALAALTQQGVLEAKGEKRGRKYRVSTTYLKQIFTGALKP